MPTKGTGVVVVADVVADGSGSLEAVVVVGAVGAEVVGVVFNGSDGSVIGTTMLLRLLWLLCGTEMPITALAVKWVLFVA
jgi:adenine/guanine phosphoribosyltransferase-like PRPP-binding protein